MSRPIILTIAGFDPCSGAGLTADIKTIEQMGGYGMALCSGWTLQTENEFVSMEWRASDILKQELQFMLNRYQVAVIKTGILPSTTLLFELLELAHALQPSIQVVVDPVLQSTTGHHFSDHAYLDSNLLRHITVITPNLTEWQRIENGQAIDKQIHFKSTALYLKSASKEQPGLDELYYNGHCLAIQPTQQTVYEKHGSGCVLASAIATGLAKGESVEAACMNGKRYTENYLISHPSKLGYHAA